MLTREYDGTRGEMVNYSKYLTEMGQKGIPHTRSKTMPGSPLMEHFMKSYKWSLQKGGYIANQSMILGHRHHWL